MSKAGNAKARRRIRSKVQAALEPFPLEYVLDEVARQLRVIGDGRISLVVRNGYVTGRHVVRLPTGDPELRRIVAVRHESPIMRALLKPDGSLNTDW